MTGPEYDDSCASPASVVVSYFLDSEPVSGYKVVCLSRIGGDSVDAVSTDTSATLSLPLGFTYTCTVTAENKAGSGPESEDSEEIITM